METITEVLQELKKKYQNKYGYSLFDVTVSHDSDTDLYILKGQVLLQSQKQHITQQVQNVLKEETAIRNEIKVLADQKEGHFIEAEYLISLYDIPQEVDKRKRSLMTQLRIGERGNVLLETDEGFSLLQCEDGALGWAPDIFMDKQSLPKKNIWKTPKVKEGKIFHRSISSKEIRRIGESYMATPYLLGGRSNEALDCSSFVQFMFLETAGILLPRHSWDQKKCGEEVSAAEGVTPGDCIFGMLKRGKDIKHVGVFLDVDHIIHASRRQKEVVIWGRELFEKIYNIKAIRRYLTVE